MTDAALVQRMANGDQAALGELYARHSVALLSLARRMLADEADDLLHDVWMEAWEHASTFDATRGSVRAWLFTRLKSRALDRLRSPRRRTGAMPERTTEQADTLDLERVAPVFASLPKEQQTVIVGTYYEGLSSTELAEREGVPVGTIKSRLATALERLRKVLA